MRVVILTVCLLFLSGCRAINVCRGNQVAQLADAVQAIERVAGDRVEIKREIDDMKPRLIAMGMDFPPPKKTVARGSAEDVRLQNAYDAFVTKKANRREFIENLTGPLRRMWEMLTFALKYAWILLGLVLFVYIRREFFRRDVVNVKHIAATVPDKDRRRRIADGSPIGRVFDRIKVAFGAAPPDSE